MKAFKKIFISIALLCNLPCIIDAKHYSMGLINNDQQDYNQQLKTTIQRHQPIDIAFKNIINPTEITLSNPNELNAPIEKIPSEDKKRKYDHDKDLRKTLKAHAQGLSDGKILNSKESLTFAKLNIHEQKDQVKKWLQDHNAHQTDQLKQTQHEYHKKVVKFKATTQQKALEDVQKIEDGIKSRNHKISAVSNKLEKLENKKTHNLDEEKTRKIDINQKAEELSRLHTQNNTDQQSIQRHLDPILSKLEELDREFKDKCNAIIEDYQTRNHHLLTTVNTIVKSKKQSLNFKTADKKMKKKSKPAPKVKIKKNQQPTMKKTDSAILNMPVEKLAQNPFLDAIVDQTHKDIASTNRSDDSYKTLKSELTHLKKAQHHRNKQKQTQK